MQAVKKLAGPRKGTQGRNGWFSDREIVYPTSREPGFSSQQREGEAVRGKEEMWIQGSRTILR